MLYVIIAFLEEPRKVIQDKGIILGKLEVRPVLQNAQESIQKIFINIKMLGMKCSYCKEPIESQIAYWLGKKVHPECFKKLKRESKKTKKIHRKSWLDKLIEERF